MTSKRLKKEENANAFEYCSMFDFVAVKSIRLPFFSFSSLFLFSITTEFLEFFLSLK